MLKHFFFYIFCCRLAPVSREQLFIPVISLIRPLEYLDYKGWSNIIRERFCFI